jgi:S-adenosylmethionine:tRNA ribosyltransferase-isomerase
MDIGSFDYELPGELIAQEPAARRDGSRLMMLDRSDGSMAHHDFSELPDLLRPGDMLVFNDSRVIPARLRGRKEGSGAAIELLLAQPSGGHSIDSHDWQAIARPARRLKAGNMVDVAQGLQVEVLGKNLDGTIDIRLHTDSDVLEALAQHGEMPLPPYIRRGAEGGDAERYQTVYAKDPGSVAAPTAGLHFTPDLIDRCRDRGIEVAFVTLHVGLGTFLPVQAARIEEHQMHSEWCHIDDATAQALYHAKREGRRIVAVGTTAVRTLESAAGVVADYGGLAVEPGWRSTDIFIYPGYQFKLVDALITNFHLPKSTLLMLVSAFYRRDPIMEAYQQAIEKRYRFYSYGDAMLII